MVILLQSLSGVGLAPKVSSWSACFSPGKSMENNCRYPDCSLTHRWSRGIVSESELFGVDNLLCSTSCVLRRILLCSISFLENVLMQLSLWLALLYLIQVINLFKEWGRKLNTAIQIWQPSSAELILHLAFQFQDCVLSRSPAWLAVDEWMLRLWVLYFGFC